MFVELEVLDMSVHATRGFCWRWKLVCTFLYIALIGILGAVLGLAG